MRQILLVLLGGAITLSAAPAAAQLGGRPAEEWAVVLESGRRMEGLDIENVVRNLNLERGAIVADIGAGTGIFSVPLATAAGPSGRVFAVEVDRGFLPMIADKAEESNLPNILPVLGRFEDPMLPTSTITLGFFHDVLHHIQNREAYLVATAKYIAPGGRIAVVDYDANHPATPHQDEPAMLITRADVDRWMAAAGFYPEREVNLFEEKFFVIYSRER